MPFDEKVLRNELTPEQYDAAVAPEREVLALACAGSGKSRTPAYRIARLIALGHDPTGIVAFTFTEEAAESIKLRVASALGRCGLDPVLVGAMSIGTIHGWCRIVLGRLDARYRQYEVLDDMRFRMYVMSRYPELLKDITGLDFRTFPWESGGSATRARSARAGMAVAGGVVCAGVGVSR